MQALPLFLQQHISPLVHFRVELGLQAQQNEAESESAIPFTLISSLPSTSSVFTCSAMTSAYAFSKIYVRAAPRDRYGKPFVSKVRKKNAFLRVRIDARDTLH